VTASCVAGSAAILIFGSHPGRNLFDGWWMFATFAVCGVIVVGDLIVALFRADKGHRRRACTLLLVMATAGVIAATLLPLSVRVLMSDYWLRPYARQLSLRQGRTDGPRNLGLFRFEGCGSHGNVVVLSTGTFGIFGSAGIAYIHGSPRSVPKDRAVFYDHLYGPWWRYRVAED
jgi:hypothetical protein